MGRVMMRDTEGSGAIDAAYTLSRARAHTHAHTHTNNEKQAWEILSESTFNIIFGMKPSQIIQRKR